MGENHYRCSGKSEPCPNANGPNGMAHFLSDTSYQSVPPVHYVKMGKIETQHLNFDA